MQEEQGHIPKIQICKILKLTNGETIIGNIVKETPSYIDINLPLKILIILHPDMVAMNLSIIKWDPTFDYMQSIRIYKNSIVACAEPNEIMKKNYADILEQKDKEEPFEDESTLTEEFDTHDAYETAQDLQDFFRRVKPSTLH